ncbi:MAG: polysaccharide deacetylase family protein [Sandaracinaceae bacterium]|nr:polysaccharide deacetylase family protein [Sandaracinaceae bacterium]
MVLLAGCVGESEENDIVRFSEEEETTLYEQAFVEAMEGKADGPDCAGTWVPDRPPFRKAVALTFDDGPRPGPTSTILQILRRHQVPATFFINGVRLRSPEAERIAREIAQDPLFILANHTWSHPDMSRIPATRVATEIDDTTAVMQQVGETLRYFRFPFGSSTCSTARAVRERQYTIVGWHIDSADWCYAAGNGVCPRNRFRFVDDDVRDNMVEYVLRQVRARGGGILLFHDIHPHTAANIERLIMALKNEGYRFVAINDPSVFPMLNRNR